MAFLFRTATILTTALIAASCSGSGHQKLSQEFPESPKDTAIVYFIEEISPESLIKLYNALGVQAQGKTAVKISTGEAGGEKIGLGTTTYKIVKLD